MSVIIRMAAVVVNGCVDASEINSQKQQQECNGKEGKLLNGKVNNDRNGYVKSTHLGNGDAVSRLSFIFITFLKFSHDV